MAELDYRQQIQDLIERQVNNQQATDREFMDYGLMKARGNLFFSDDAMLEYFASEKFPDDPSAVARFRYKDGELIYTDYDGSIKKVFEPGEDVGWFENYVFPNIVPASTLVADVGGGMAGAGAGFKKGLDISKNIKHPLAKLVVTLGTTAIGGFGGNFVVGGVARSGREALIDMFYNLPPEEIKAAFDDLLVSSGFSAIPFGAGPTRNVVNKFIGKEDNLRYLMNLRKNNQEIIDEAAQMGIQLTQAEAADIGTRAIGLQYFLSRQPQIESVRKFYDSRASKAREAIQKLADSFGSQSGKFGDINARVADAAKQALDKMAEDRRVRATAIYDSIRQAPDPVLVDTSPIIKRIDDTLTNPELDPDVVEALTSFKNLLFDRDGNQIQNLMSLHDRRAGSIENLIKANLGTNQGNRLISLREDLTTLFKAAEPNYALAQRIYDPTKPSLQMVEHSVIGTLSKAMTDKATARAVLKLFDPDVSEKSLRTAKETLLKTDPDAFLDAKKFFIVDKLDDLMRQSIDQGLPQFQQFFAKSKNARLMKTMLEPEEYANFERMIEILGKAMSVPKGGSQTQPLLAIEKSLAGDTSGLGMKSAKFLLAAIRLPGRLIQGTIGDDLLRSIAMRQADTYYKALADSLFDPDAAINIERAYQYFAPLEFGVKQATTRGVTEGVETITAEDDEYKATRDQLDRMIQQQIEQQSTQPPQSSLNMFDPLPDASRAPVTGDFDPATSAIVLPRADDRELAMRLRGPLGGIASLA
tara:strand:- start:344 stop:2611 length:2268 start_codon:yes stop_codon:yes gene_type:complete